MAAVIGKSRGQTISSSLRKSCEEIAIEVQEPQTYRLPGEGRDPCFRRFTLFKQLQCLT
jgi:hypothetical protein